MLTDDCVDLIRVLRDDEGDVQAVGLHLAFFDDLSLLGVIIAVLVELGLQSLIQLLPDLGGAVLILGANQDDLRHRHARRIDAAGVIVDHILRDAVAAVQLFG